MYTGRALHWVFKIGNRTETINFYRNVLGMQILRHEEFDSGCEATCNGPYDNKWSKTMVGYDHEDTQFVAELTYNYGIGSYQLGNDFRCLTVESDTAYDNISKGGKWPIAGHTKDTIEVISPGGYKFCVKKGPGIVSLVSISISNLAKSIEYWRNILGLSVYSEKAKSVLLGFASDQCKLELVQIEEPIEHLTGIGRIAYSCSLSDQVVIRDAVKKAGGKILNDLDDIPTPGKATVRVLIIVDPDGYEICFVGDEAYRQLSQMDPRSDELLKKAMDDDQSNEWFEKKGIPKSTA